MSSDFEQRFKGLVSEHVDAQLAGHREPPAFGSTGQQGRVVDIRTRMRRRPWALPLLAAVCVVLVVGGTAGAVTLLSENGPAPATTNQPTVVDPSRSTSTPAPSSTAGRTSKVVPKPSATTTRTTPAATSTGSAGTSSAAGSSSNPPSATRSYVPPPTSPPTSRVIVRPVHADGTPVAGYTVRAEKHDDGFSCGSYASPAAVDANIHFCGSSADSTVACWNSTHGTVLCLRDGTKQLLVRIRLSGPLSSIAAPKSPEPINMTLVDGTYCDIRDGGAADPSKQHPSWIPYYYCASGQKAVYGPRNDDGIDETESPWTVVVFPISGVGAGRNQSVRTAYFVGTAK